jgi:hypothetical protein
MWLRVGHLYIVRYCHMTCQHSQIFNSIWLIQWGYYFALYCTYVIFKPRLVNAHFTFQDRHTMYYGHVTGTARGYTKIHVVIKILFYRNHLLMLVPGYTRCLCYLLTCMYVVNIVSPLTFQTARKRRSSHYKFNGRVEGE